MVSSLQPNTEADSAIKMIRVSVVEDNAKLREQLIDKIKRAPGFILLSSHHSAEDALKEIPNQKPDVVLMDINLPKMSGIDCVRQLKKKLKGTNFVMLTVYEDADAIFKSLLAGAVGYLLKGRSGSGNQVLEALRDANQGGSPLNSLIARKIVQHFHRQPVNSETEQALTPRECEVLELLSKGLLYKEIADKLTVNIETVRKHCHNIYERLQVSSRTEAVVKSLHP